MNRFYVYELIDPRNNKPFYIGKGRGNRMYSHVSEANRGKHQWSNVLKCERIVSILSKGFSIGYNKVKDDLDEIDALLIEETLIDKYGLIINRSGILTNIRLNKQHHYSIPGRRLKSKSVHQCTLTGEILNQFSSVTAAADSIHKHKTNILNCCNGQRHTAYGYVWKFVENEFIPPPTEVEYHVNRRLPINQYTLKGNLLNTFSSIRDAEKETGVDCSSISRCCRNYRKTAGGFKWKFR